MVPGDAYELHRVPNRSGIVISCEHASARLPDRWSWPTEDRWLLDEHWSHDIGAAALAREIATAASAPAVLARFSRLLVDPNRPLESETLIRREADGRPVHLNRDVDEQEQARRVAYWKAYHRRLSEMAADPGAHTIFAVHSFTPTYEGERRDFEIGVLFDEDERVAEELAAALSDFATTRLNEPYSGKEGMIYAAHRHATANGLRAVEIEVRQDRVVDPSFRARITRAVVKVLCSTLAFLALLAMATPAEASPSLYTVDGEGTVRATGKSRASLQRTPPAQLPSDPSQPHGDPDALRYLLSGSEAELPSIVDIASVNELGEPVAVLKTVPLSSVPCPAIVGRAAKSCAATEPIRVVADAIDAGHPLVRSRSVVGRLGGALRVVGAGAEVLGVVRVTGPRALGVTRLRGKLRFLAVRLSAGGALPIGQDDASLREVALAALERVNGLWGECGISFGHPSDLDLTVVDPPPSHLLAVGCAHGVVASGGELRFRVGRGGASRPGRQISVSTEPGMTASAVARRVAAALRRAGWRATVSDNPRMMAGAGPSSDVSVRSASGELARLDPPAAGDLSSDATLGACIGSVNLEDGLLHFTDVDSMVGTVEERTLVKAHDDHEPSTIDIFLVPGFARGGRIGESFIGTDGGSIRNVVIIDRAGVRSNRASFTLAHEIGHVLLDDPGHPDDYGVDTPTRLMDADAADGSAFGPRRIPLEECGRALRQSGPKAYTPLLEAWPLAKLPPLAMRRGVPGPNPLPQPWLRAVY